MVRSISRWRVAAYFDGVQFARYPETLNQYFRADRHRHSRHAFAKRGPGWLTAIKSQNGYVGLDPNYGPAADRRKGISVILGRRRTVKICSIWSPGPAFTLDTSKTAQR